MDGTEIILLVAALMLCVRLIAGALDGYRIRDYFVTRDCELLAREWRPFGPGWLDHGTARLYDIEYRDAIGQRCRAIAKTSIWSGVYLTEQAVIAATDNGEVPTESPAAELARLRAENAQLRADLEQPRG